MPCGMGVMRLTMKSGLIFASGFLLGAWISPYSSDCEVSHPRPCLRSSSSTVRHGKREEVSGVSTGGPDRNASKAATPEAFGAHEVWGVASPHGHVSSLLGESVSRDAPGQWAVVSVYVDHIHGAAWKDGGMFLGSLITRCSARNHGSQAQFILYHIGLDEGLWADTLRYVGWHLKNMTPVKRFVKKIYHPIYSEKVANKLNRSWPPNTVVQMRRDGWATYIKYFAWLEKFQRVLVSDTDVLFKSNPDRLFDGLRPDLLFVTVLTGNAGRKGLGAGIHSFFHMVRPSNAVFDDIVIRSHTGNYYPFTNTEQDVYEARFPPLQFALNRTEWRKFVGYSHSKKYFGCKLNDVQQWRETMTLDSFCQNVVSRCWENAPWK